MSVENSTASQTSGNISKTLLDNTTKMAEFFDPAWQLAMTVEFYFQYAIIAIGVFGTAANALVLYALISHSARQVKKRAVNLLIIHQNILDLTCCILLIITFSVRVNNFYLAGTLGYFICTVFTSEMAVYCTLYGSLINLMSLTVERYLKVVHPFWSKKKLKRWIIYAAILFAWVCGILSVAPMVFVSTIVQDGVCLSFYVWESKAVRMGIMIWTTVSYLVLPVFIFIYCYGRIVVVMKRQMRVMAGHGSTGGSAQPTASQIQNQRIKWNIIKTMIIVSVLFVVCWSPLSIYWLIVDNTETSGTDLFVGYSATLFLAYLNVCVNPFIYASKHDGVKEKLVSIMKKLCCRSRHNDVSASGRAADDNKSDRDGRIQHNSSVRHS